MPLARRKPLTTLLSGCLARTRLGTEAGDAVDRVLNEVKAVQIVHDHHVERRGRRPLFLVPASGPR
jgi:hypothetical protein